MADITESSVNQIAVEDLTTLQPASNLQSIYTTAEHNSILMSLAYTINTAANCGRGEVLWQHELPDSIKEKLEQEGYKCAKILTCANPGRLWVISWSKSI